MWNLLAGVMLSCCGLWLVILHMGQRTSVIIYAYSFLRIYYVPSPLFIHVFSLLIVTSSLGKRHQPCLWVWKVRCSNLSKPLSQDSIMILVLEGMAACPTFLSSSLSFSLSLSLPFSLPFSTRPPFLFLLLISLLPRKAPWHEPVNLQM